MQLRQGEKVNYVCSVTMTAIMLSQGWMEQSHQARPIRSVYNTGTRSCGGKGRAQEWGSEVVRNPRLSATVSSTCWLPLTPKSLYTAFPNRGPLSRSRFKLGARRCTRQLTKTAAVALLRGQQCIGYYYGLFGTQSPKGEMELRR